MEQGRTKRQVLGPTLWGQDQQRPPRFLKPAPQRGGDGQGHQERKRHPTVQSGFAARLLPDPKDPFQIPAGHSEKGPAYVGGTKGAPSRAAHPALAEQVQTATLGLDIEGGAHRGPAGADLSGPDPGSDAAQARSPRP